jgi:hypothetical protein
MRWYPTTALGGTRPPTREFDVGVWDRLGWFRPVSFRPGSHYRSHLEQVDARERIVQHRHVGAERERDRVVAEP